MNGTGFFAFVGGILVALLAGGVVISFFMFVFRILPNALVKCRKCKCRFVLMKYKYEWLMTTDDRCKIFFVPEIRRKCLFCGDDVLILRKARKAFVSQNKQVVP